MAMNSIRSKAVALYVVVFLSVALLVTTLSYFIMKNYLNKLQREKLELGAQQMAKHIKYRVLEKENLFRLIAGGKPIEVFVVTWQEPMLAEYFSGFRNDFPKLSIISYEGVEEFKLERGAVSRELLDVSESEIYKAAIAFPGKVIVLPVDRGVKEPSVMFSYASQSYFDEPLGVLIGEVPLSELTRDLRGYRFGETGSAILIDGGRNILSHPKGEMIFKKIEGKGAEANAVISEAVKHRAGFGRATIQGVDGYVAYSPVEDRDWSVMVVLPYEEFIAVPKAMRNTVLIVFFSLIVIGMPALFYFVVGITEPLKKLVTATDAIARGDLRQTVDIRAKDEVGMLGRSFNVMTEALRASREALEKSNETLHKLSAHMLTVREEERRAVARQVHDELGQALSTLKLDLTWMKKKFPPDMGNLNGKVEEMSGLIDFTIETVQRITSELRPLLLDDLGLAAAIEWQAGVFQERTGIRCEVNLPSKEIVLDKAVSDSLFRVYQEAMVNIARHAGATDVRIELRVEPDKLLMEITDNGRGIDEADADSSTAFGLMGMRERIGLLDGDVTIGGREGSGTVVLVSIPLNTY